MEASQTHSLVWFENRLNHERKMSVKYIANYTSTFPGLKASLSTRIDDVRMLCAPISNTYAIAPASDQTQCQISLGNISWSECDVSGIQVDLHPIH